MEEIIHRTVNVNGIKMHVAEKGKGQVVLFLHGFPGLWYTWRHQIADVAVKGYRAVAPDLRGYGDTDSPSSIQEYSIFHIVGDLVALIESFGQDQVFVVGHDWGAQLAWNLCLFRPEKVKAMVNLGVAYMPRYPLIKPLDYFRLTYGDEYYVCRFQEPGDIEAEFNHLGTKLVLKKFFSIREPGPLYIPKKGWDSPEDQITLPSWISEQDIDYFVSKFEKTGFTGPVNYYRNLNPNWELGAPWTEAKINVPTKFIVGDLDMSYHYPGIQEYILKGGFKEFVPQLEDVVVMKDVGHYINEEKPREISDHILQFIQKF